MLTETVLEILRFFCRHELEALQMSSRYLRDLVDRYAGDLPLRRISSVSVSNAGSVSIALKEGSAFAEDSRIRVQRPSSSGHHKSFHRVNNAFFEVWSTGFANDALLRYLRDHAGDLRCRIDVLHLKASSDTEANVDNALVDFVASNLKPRKLTSHIDAEQDWHVMLFHRGIMRRTIEHVAHDFCTFYQMAAFINGIPRLFDVDALQTFAFHAFEDPTAWILQFVHPYKAPLWHQPDVGKQNPITCHSRTTWPGIVGNSRPAFETAGLEARVVPYITHSYDYDMMTTMMQTFLGFGPGPWHVNVAHSLGEPLRTDVSAPPCDYPSRRGVVTKTDAALFAFENKKLGKKLELYSWEVEERTETRRLPYRSSHFMLKTLDL